MSKRTRHTRRVRTSLVAGIVTVLSGALFAISAQVAQNTGTERHPESVIQLVRQRSEHVATLTDEVTALNDELTQLVAEESSTNANNTTSRPVDQRLTGANEVTGSGIIVTLDDAKTDVIPPGAVPDDLVVHQQDIQAVMNALWRSGAKAMSIQGKRVTPQTAIRCVGSVLYLQGQVYSPPYEIVAIGDSDTLVAGIETDPDIAIYQEYVAAYGLGWDVRIADDLLVDAAEGTARLNYATPLAAP